MAYNSPNRSERLLQGRRFTTDGLNLTQEAFTDVFDLGANEIFTDDGLIPTGSSQLPYSGSSQDGLIISASLVNPSTYTEGSEEDLQIVKYHYRKKLKGAADATREIYYFTTDDPDTHDDYVTSDQIIEADQQTNFVSPKYIIPGHASRNAESITPGYKIAISYGNDENNVTAATDDQFVFDYKTGVLTWVGTPPHDGNDFVFATTYQYVGRTLRSQIDDGSIGGSDFTAAGISGSFIATSASIAADIAANSASITVLEANEVHTAAAISGSTQFTVAGQDDSFTVGQESTINFISGSAGITVLSNSTDTITIGASTDNVTLNQITASIVSASGGITGDVTGDLTGTATEINLSAVAGSSNELPIILSKAVSPNDTIGFTQTGTGTKFTYNPGLGEIKIGSSNIESTYGFAEIQGGSGLPLDRFKINTDGSAITKTEIGASTSDVVFGDDVYISGSLNASTDLNTFTLLNTNTTTINFGGAATTLNIGNAAGTVSIAGSASIAGDLTVQGTVTSIETENLNVSDQFILLASGSTGTKDGGIIVQSGSNGVGTALYFDANANRWAVNPANTVNWNDTSLTPKQYVVSVSASAAAPLSTPLDFGDSSEYYGMMHVNTDNGEIYIYS